MSVDGNLILPENGLCFTVSINPLWPGQKLRPQAEDEFRWGRHTRAWRTETHTLESFAARICVEGCAFCSALKAPWRKESSFEFLQVLAADQDHASLETLLEDSFIQDHATLVYETTSSTPLAPRSRPVYILDQPITDPDRARLAYRALIHHFAHGAPDAVADRASPNTFLSVLASGITVVGIDSWLRRLGLGAVV